MLDEQLHDELLFGLDVQFIAYMTALRSVLERHQGINGVCRVCEEGSPCSDEAAVIDALLGPDTP